MNLMVYIHTIFQHLLFSIKCSVLQTQIISIIDYRIVILQKKILFFEDILISMMERLQLFIILFLLRQKSNSCIILTK